MIGIYKITNTINSHAYIGQSIDIHRRGLNEQSRAFQETAIEYNSVLFRAFRKYGLDNFIFEVLEEVAIEDLDMREQYGANYFNSYTPNGYNVAECGHQRNNHAKPVGTNQVTRLLLEGKSNLEIANIIGTISGRTVSDFNCGKCGYDKNTDYPIRTMVHNIKCRYTDKKEQNFNKPKKNKIKKIIIEGKKVSYIEREKASVIEERYNKEVLLAELYQHYQDGTMKDGSAYHNISDMQLRRVLKRLNISTIPAYRKQLKEKQLITKTAKKLDTCVVREDGKEYLNGSQAAKDNGGDDKGATHIYECCNNKRRTAYGHIGHFKIPRN